MEKFKLEMFVLSMFLLAIALWVPQRSRRHPATKPVDQPILKNSLPPNSALLLIFFGHGSSSFWL
jgi:hypothetical protein